jgi:hypothetical protein
MDAISMLYQGTAGVVVSSPDHAANYPPLLGGGEYVLLRINETVAGHAKALLQLTADAVALIGKKTSPGDLAQIMGDLAQFFSDSHISAVAAALPAILPILQSSMPAWLKYFQLGMALYVAYSSAGL